jgi:hypothetical protein
LVKPVVALKVLPLEVVAANVIVAAGTSVTEIFTMVTLPVLQTVPWKVMGAPGAKQLLSQSLVIVSPG